MAQVIVRHVDDDVARKLKRRARRNGRSMEEELRHILRDAARDEARTVGRLGSRIAARFGIPVEGATIYTTMQSCFGCAKALVQAAIKRVVYKHAWSPSDADDPEMEIRKKGEHEKLFSRFDMKQIKLPDSDEVWAVSSLRKKSPPQQPRVEGTA